MEPGFYNMDCMDAMKQFPDKFFDLAIVDPPYGGGFTEGGGCKGWFTKYHTDGKNIGGGVRFGGRFDRYKEDDTDMRNVGDKILDTHVGSASSLIACHRAGLEYWGFEIDQAYYKAAKERLDRETAQVNINDFL